MVVVAQKQGQSLNNFLVSHKKTYYILAHEQAVFDYCRRFFVQSAVIRPAVALRALNFFSPFLCVIFASGKPSLPAPICDLAWSTP
jgi:hypothetical protein